MPPGWTKAGEWGVRDNVVLGENAVSFYSVTEEARLALVDNLSRFTTLLPPGVIRTAELSR